MKHLLVASALAAGCSFVCPSTVRAQSSDAVTTITPIQVVAPTQVRPPPASVWLAHVDGEPARAMIWGAGLEPTGCELPCELHGGFGQYGVTVAAGRAAWSTGFVLDPGRARTRVNLRPPSLGRAVGGAFMIAIGGAATAAGVGTGITALFAIGSSFGFVFGVLITLPLLATGVPLLVGGIAVVNAAAPAAVIDPDAPAGDERARYAAGVGLVPRAFAVRF